MDGRARGRSRDEEPAAAGGRARRDRGTPAAAPVAARGEGAGAVVALPGERLARVAGSLTEADLAAAEVFRLDDLDGSADAEAGEPVEAGQAPDAEGGEPRRRRRRGGRGRGRGRGRADEAQPGSEDEAERGEAAPLAPRSRGTQARPVQADEEDVAPRRAPRSTPFGSVWDSQLGTPAAPAAASLTPLPDDEDFDEPEIPEYLIAEQRRGGNRGGGRGGPRGGRSAYQSAMERERYGRGGGGGINRYPDVSARTRAPEPRRDDRGYGRGDRTPPPPRTSNEPWSDVPPELEAMLRAQVAQKPAPRPANAPEPAADVADAATPPKARSTRKPVTRAARATAGPVVDEVAAPAATEDRGASGAPAAATSAVARRRPGRPPKAATAAAAESEIAPVDVGPAHAVESAKPRATRKPAAKTATPAGRTAATRASRAKTDAVPPDDAAVAPAPGTKRRTTRKAANGEPA